MSEEVFGQEVPKPEVELSEAVVATEPVVETVSDPPPVAEPVDPNLPAALALVLAQVEADNSLPRVHKKNVIRTLQGYA